LKPIILTVLQFTRTRVENIRELAKITNNLRRYIYTKLESCAYKINIPGLKEARRFTT
jgi:hypothetical protein